MTSTRDITDFRHNQKTDWTLLSSLVNNIYRVCYQRSSLELDIIQSLLKHDYINNKEGVDLWWYEHKEDTITSELIRNFNNKRYKNSVGWYMEENLKVGVFKLKVDKDTKELSIVSVVDEKISFPFDAITQEHTLRLPYHYCYDEAALLELRKYWYEDWKESAQDFERILHEIDVDTFTMIENLLSKYPNVTLQVVEKDYDKGGSKRIEEVVGVAKNDVGLKYLLTKRGEKLDASNYVVYNYELISLLMKGEI